MSGGEFNGKISEFEFIKLATTAPSGQGRAGNYRSDIDGLRAVAVLAVIINHVNENILPLGYLGVDVFFVISGFVITRSLLEKQLFSPREFIKEFYAKRFRRILPALLVCILITAVLISLLSPNAGESLQTGLAAVFGLANIQLIERSADYFATTTKLNAFTHTWSLGVEEQFYFYYPLIFAVTAAAIPARRFFKYGVWIVAILAAVLLASKALLGSYFSLLPGGISTLINYLPYGLLALVIPLASLAAGPTPMAAGTTRTAKTAARKGPTARWRLMVVLALATIISCLYFILNYDTRFAIAYYSMPARFWELAAGCLIMLFAAGRDSAAAVKGPSLLRRAQPLILPLCLLTFCLPTAHGKWATVLIVALTCLLIHTCRPGQLDHRLLTTAWARKIGLISYSLYLWHWSVLCLSRWTIGIHWWSLPLQLLAMFCLALASYHWVEQPLRQASWLRSRSRTFQTGITAMLASSALLLSLNQLAEKISLDRRIANRETTKLKEEKDVFISDRITNRFIAAKLDHQLTHDDQSRPLRRPRVYVLGDSHAFQYLASLAAAMPERGIANGTTGWRCGYIAAADIEPLTRQWMEGCERYRPAVDRFLRANLGRDDVVLVAHRWLEKKNKPHQQAVLRELARLVASKQSYLLLIDDVPELKVDDPILCVQRPWRPFPFPGCTRSISDLDLDQRPLDLMAERLQSEFGNVRYLKLRHLYCEASSCGAYKDGLFLYKDNNHLNAQASQPGAALIARTIRSLPGR